MYNVVNLSGRTVLRTRFRWRANRRVQSGLIKVQSEWIDLRGFFSIVKD